MSAASLRDVGAAHGPSRCRCPPPSAPGASLTPSPVIATTSPSLAQDAREPQLLLGVDAGEDDVLLASRRASSSSSRLAELRAGSRARRRPTRPMRRAIASAVQPAVAGDHDDADARLRRQRATASGTSGRGGSSMPTTPRSSSSRSTCVRAVARLRGASVRRATASTRSAFRSISSAAASAALPLGLGQRRAGDDLLGGPLHVRDPRLAAAQVDRRHPLARRVEGDLRDARAARRLLLGAEPSLGRQHDEGALGRVADDRSPRSAPGSGGVVAEQPGAQELGERPRVDHLRRRGGSGRTARSPRPRRRTSPSSVQTRWTVIWFSVSVPVLSVQMTVVSPRVSTAESRRTSALRRAIRCVAERERERHRRQEPLGDVRHHDADREHEALPEAHAERAGDEEEGGAEARREDGDEARHVVELALERARAPSASPASSAAMRPNSVSMPVATTTASAVPRGHVRAGEDALLRLDGARLPRQRSSCRRAAPSPDEFGVGARSRSPAASRTGRRRGRAPRPGSRRPRRRDARAPSAAAGACSASVGTLGPVLLDEGEDRVDEDDGDDRDRELRHPAGSASSGAGPEEQREEVDELGERSGGGAKAAAARRGRSARPRRGGALPRARRARAGPRRSRLGGRCAHDDDRVHGQLPRVSLQVSALHGAASSGRHAGPLRLFRRRNGAAYGCRLPIRVPPWDDHGADLRRHLAGRRLPALRGQARRRPPAAQSRGLGDGCPPVAPPPALRGDRPRADGTRTRGAA